MGTITKTKLMQRIQNITLVLGYTSAISLTRGGLGGGYKPVEPFNGLNLGDERISDVFTAADADSSETLDCTEFQDVLAEHGDEDQMTKGITKKLIKRFDEDSDRALNDRIRCSCQLRTRTYSSSRSRRYHSRLRAAFRH